MTTMEKARHVAAQAWCDPKASSKVMDEVLCEAFARRLAMALDHLDAVTEIAIWMSGSGDFSPEGQAGEGWAKARPMVHAALRYVNDPALAAQSKACGGRTVYGDGCDLPGGHGGVCQSYSDPDPAGEKS